MPERVYKDGCRIAITEYEIRSIDRWGDAQNVDHCETKVEALKTLAKFEPSGDIVAMVIEKHVSRRPSHMFDEPDTYTKIANVGNAEALHAGGWDQD